MNHVRWAVQTNLGSADDIEKLCLTLERLDVELVKLKVIPFDDTPPDVPADGRVIFYGSTTLMRNVAREGRWAPGVFFDEARFSFEALREGFGAESLLNGASEVVTVGELLARDLAPDAEFFLRPAGDLKEFAGRVHTFAELAPWRDGLASSNGPLGLDTLVQVAPPRALGREWRTVVVDGRVVAASQYRSSGRLKVTGDVPDDVIRFAGEMAARYQPAPVFALDVGEVDEGLRVVETNCFNSAGFYWCDLYEVARSVTAFVRAM
ncbi:MAG: ATP-grasp domain-containing protein [Polyangiales bacterium]